MPFQRDWDHEHGFFLARGRGVVGEEETLALLAELYGSEASREGALALFDLRAVDAVRVTPEGIRRMARVADELAPPRVRMAFVTQDVLVRGMARMYALLRQDSGEEASVFGDVSEALVWLGVDDPPIQGLDPP